MRRRLVAVAVAWLVTVGVAWGAVGLPERCPPLTPDGARAAAVATVDWFDRNQLPDGRWVYRYGIETGTVDRQPHTVRHSGVTMSLYQAHAAGIDGALEVADAGTGWSLDNLERQGDLAMVAPGRYAPSGGTALLVAGLATRRIETGDDRYDDELFAMGRFLRAVTERSGAVLQDWDTRAGAPVPDRYSLFFTGEAYYALALLATVDPGGPWAGTASRIGHYLATERDQAEDRFPPTSDHWAAYGLATWATTGHPLDDDAAGHAERLAGIFGVQVRYESQRTGEGLNRWVLRGPHALGAGVGTLGEGLGSLWTLTGPGQPLEEHRAVVGERLRCVAGILAERQVGEEEAAGSPSPGLAEGAWFRLGWTQMDDQQHALSALLLAEPALAESSPRGSTSGDGDVAGALWLMVVAVALVNPFRLRELVRRREAPAAAPRTAEQEPAADAADPTGGADPTGDGGPDGRRRRGRELGRSLAGAMVGITTLAVPAVACIGTLALVALVAPPLLRSIDVSPPTALIAAGLVVGLTAVVDFVRPGAEPVPDVPRRLSTVVPLLVPGVLRPAVALLVLAVAADAGRAEAMAVTVAVVASALATLRPPTGEPGPLAMAGWRAAAALAAFGGVALMADGIFSI